METREKVAIITGNDPTTSESRYHRYLMSKQKMADISRVRDTLWVSINNKMPGGASGIGAGTAIEFASKGIRLTLVDLNQDRLEKTKLLCQEAGLPSDKVLTLKGDVTDDEFVETVVQDTVSKFGRLDIMVNNAGTGGGPPGNFVDVPMEIYDKVMRTNLGTPIIFTRAAVPHLEKTKGCIVNVSSHSTQLAFPRVLFYSVSKAGLDQMTKCSSTELAGRGIRVNAVNPGITETSIYESFGISQPVYEKSCRAMVDLQPLKHQGKPEDIAKVIYFLASDDAKFITGVTMIVDGGFVNVIPVPNIQDL